MKDVIFITGGTGFLGTEIVAGLLRDTASDIYVLVRAESDEAAKHRLRASWQHSEELCRSIGVRTFAVRGDFTQQDLALDPAAAAMLRERITLVYHCGAEIGFQADERQLQLTNCKGTENLLVFASGLVRLRRFIHISTAYVAGQNTGLIMEDAPAATAFSSLYEKSKEEAEALVRISGLPFSICRPGMIIGNSVTGRAKNFNTIYYVLKLMLLGRMRVLPVSSDTRLNLVPVDYVADAAIRIGSSDEAEGKTFHLTCPAELAPRAGELADYVRLWAGRMLGIEVARPVFLPFHGLKKAGLAHNRKAEGRKKTPLSNLLTLLPYFFSDQEFDRTNTDAIAGKYDLDWRLYIDAILSFACRHNFMRQDGSTVFKQAMLRRASKRYPVNYYDVSAEGIRQLDGPSANERIEQVRRALWAHGVRGGDRIALTGINSTDYMILEQAIGLLGAVGVPLYYTTPADEISLLLSRSGAGWFFVGDQRIAKQIPNIRTDARIVTFSVADGSDSADESSGSAAASSDFPEVLTWNEFLSADAGPAPMQHPDPDDLATIRYTSGTTGEPKGVMFTFAQLAWMGQVMTELLPWEERNRSMRYLSFLPLSHVVEGILASYAPYYMLAEAGFYYLNDFGYLTEALPKVRPNVFFSVPRFYEKLWDQIRQSGAGKRWMSQKPGPTKNALAALVRKVALRKAGLDSCSQLIVGSAPVSETLLQNFRALGIEIHNAYGQTEAPLITINRAGNNVIPTIGTPLPETEVQCAPDGELLVRGPQVAAGYYGMETDTIREGLLKTGDLGIIHDSGHITLIGRKKDMIVTAYGKNISIPKIEQRLKDIPGVSEAVLIGEHRPYCTALLWREDSLAEGSDERSPADTTAGAAPPDTAAGAARDRIAQAIDRMNETLSHPEQVRRFRIIKKPLSIQAGELTPNLKVKRNAVQEHLKETIEEMYQA